MVEGLEGVEAELMQALGVALWAAVGAYWQQQLACRWYNRSPTGVPRLLAVWAAPAEAAAMLQEQLLHETLLPAVLVAPPIHHQLV